MKRDDTESYLMRTKRPNHQLSLAFSTPTTGEACPRIEGGTEARTTRRPPERPASAVGLMEEVCERENLKQVLSMATVDPRALTVS